MHTLAGRLLIAGLGWMLAVAVLADTPAIQELQGTWTVSAAEQSGKPFDAIKGGTLTITGEAFALHTAAGNELSGKLQLTTDTSPKQIDFLLSNGEVWEGIYSTTTTTFRLNYVERAGGVRRPVIFATTADTAGTVIMMRKTNPASVHYTAFIDRSGLIELAYCS